MIDRHKLYDLIYDKADKLLKQFNPCGIYRDEHQILVCNNKQMCSRGGEKLCCFQCHYISPKGCTIKCLACKVSMCNIPSRAYHQKFQFDRDCLKIGTGEVFRIKMWKLIRITMRYKLFFLHSTKRETFEHYSIAIGV